MSQSVPYLAVLLFAVLLICVSAHADTPTPTPSAVARALADPRRPADQVCLDATRKPAELIAFARLKRD
jgi:predicted methyltransferase